MNQKQQREMINSPPLRNRLDEEVLLKTNEERKKYGLKPFRPHPRLRMMAARHSEQMLLHRFFSHENPFEPRFRTLTDRMQSVMGNGFAGFRCFGENIAKSPTLKGDDKFEIRIEGGIPHFYDLHGNEMFRYTVDEFARAVVTGWMNSPGHRANILNPQYEYLGCGCAGFQQDLGNGAVVSYYYLTQNFGGGEITEQ